MYEELVYRAAQVDRERDANRYAEHGMQLSLLNGKAQRQTAPIARVKRAVARLTTAIGA